VEVTDTTLTELTDEVAKAIQNYRKAKWMNEDPNAPNIKEYDLADIGEFVEELISHSDAVKQSEVTLPGEVYWKNILVSKIRVIGIIGGFDLMQKVHSQLDNLPDDQGFNYAQVFDSYADGIAGWMN